MMPRRAFVRGTLGATAAALVGACRPTEVASPPATTPESASHDWAALADTIEGRVVLPSNGEYAAAKRVFNSRFDNSAPAAIVAAQSIGDVQKAVAFAGKGGTKIVARSGGHSYIGASAANGTMVVDLRHLPSGVGYDDLSGLATISAGAELDSVLTALAAHGRSIPSGSCPTVGVAGLTLGGGLGSDARRRGLTCDALVSASVVLPSGEAIRVTADDHDDLFWALRGGGGGSFGVVTSFVFRTFPATDRDVVTLEFPEGATAQTVLGWDRWLRDADQSIWGMVNIPVGPGAEGATIVLATAAGAGPGLASDLSTAIGVSPVANTSRTLGRMDFVHYFEGGEQATHPRAFVAGSDIVGRMTPAAAEAIAAATSAWPAQEGSATAVVESLSGAIGDVDSGDTAFPWRRQAACIQWYAETPSQGLVDAAQNWLASAHQTLGANSVGGYANYVEPNTPPSRYFGSNLDRLAAIRQKYDPNGLMYSGMGL